MLSKILFSILSLSFVGLVSSSFGQENVQLEKAKQELENRGEVYFCFLIPGTYSLSWLSNQLSVDKVKGDTVFAYANASQFESFHSLGIDYTILIPPSLCVQKQGSLKTTQEESWQNYPTYNTYIEMMGQFIKDHPEICSLVEIGESIGGKKILAVKISDNVSEDETEPEVFYTSTMHGDEPSGFVLMLRLIDYILQNYSVNDQITYLVDNEEIYINPLANPDGLYFLSDTSVYGAKRFNLNNVDLNRNFPDIDGTFYPDIQPENQQMIDFMQHRNLVLSANFHDGEEVVNYPWDRWIRRHPDNDWFIHISREYADTVHKYATYGYMTFLNNGITNGYDWYEVTGGRQDYVTYFLHGREVTIELTQIKFPVGNELLQLWNSNRNSLINYLNNCFKGIKGIVQDAVTGESLKALISIDNHDADNSFVYSDSVTGVFYRMLQAGTYEITFSSDGYDTKTIEALVPENGQINLDVLLSHGALDFWVSPNPVTEKLNIKFSEAITDQIIVQLFDITGRLVLNKTYKITDSNLLNVETGSLGNGVYIVHVSGNQINKSVKLVYTPIRP